MTHADVVRAAAAWAKTRYPVVITELQSGGSEHADVYAVQAGHSAVIECKVSRSDFTRDTQKVSVRSGNLMGNLRYYCAPTGLLRQDEMPPNYGLLEVGKSGKARCTKRAEYDLRPDGRRLNLRGERMLLVSALRRLIGAGATGISVKVYTHQTECCATVSAAWEEESDAT